MHSRPLTVDFYIDRSIVLRDGEPAAEILREASKNFDLIVLGFRGEHTSGIGLGSVVKRVVTNASCSVLVIR